MMSIIGMKYCHDCLTPISKNLDKEYCDICMKDRSIKI